MPVKHLISPGIGFSPGKVHYIVTRGLSIGAVGPAAFIFAYLKTSASQTAYVETSASQTAYAKVASSQTVQVETP